SEVIGRVVRTRTAVSPLFVSVGHRISLDAAVDWTLRLCQRDRNGAVSYRLPEPTRLADQLSKGRNLKAATPGKQVQMF
ncbi:MAG TPA: endonuclease V, partial [Dehalococcoidia bacterium]|nr:endonuclease V [Dehalococcoidia bacterium]